MTRVSTVALVVLALLAFARGAAADTSLGTVDGIAYVNDQTPSVPSGSPSPTVFAHCPAERELVGGGAAMNYSGTGAHLYWVYPTTTEGDEGSQALAFWNNSGAPLVGTATAACARRADPGFFPGNDDLFSAPDTLTVTAKCPESRQVSGGGVFINLEGADEGVISSSYPVDDGDPDNAPDDGWKVRVRSRAGIGGPTTAYALCTDRPAIAYRSKSLDLAVSGANQPSVSCGNEGAALSAGIQISGTASEAILNRLETYDGGDDDVAPDDGGWAHVANTLEVKPARVFVLCKRG